MDRWVDRSERGGQVDGQVGGRGWTGVVASSLWSPFLPLSPSGPTPASPHVSLAWGETQHLPAT